MITNHAVNRLLYFVMNCCTTNSTCCFAADLLLIGSLVNGPWQFNITLQVSDQFGNVYSQTVTVAVNPPPLVTTIAADTTFRLDTTTC